MKRISSGSKDSPIAIDDSEEEVVLELLDSNVANMTSTTRPSSAKNQDMRLLQGNMANHVASHNGNTHLKDRDLQVHGGQKRKRTHADQHDDYVADSKLQSPTLETRFSNTLSKKARKRRRKLERQAMEMTHPQQQTWVNRMNQLLPPFPWAPDNLPYQVPDSPSQVTLLTSPHPSLHQESRTKVSYGTLPSDGPIASTSAWVSSMALAAEKTPQVVVDSWNPPPAPQAPHSKRPTALEMTRIPPHHISVHPLPPKPHLEQPLASSEPLEISRPPPPTIGMKPDQDPSSKHGLFEAPATESSNGPSAKLYLPNPARTLVIEQLPKSHRNADWINSWCKTACDAHPVHLSINAQGAKALVEFATAELARKAWGSPRLGSNFAGLKSHQLKGKPREDLIKVWWYRVDGIGAGAGVGEIEEGEIEGDAAEKEVEVPAKKETKKERKARLAKERLDKQQKLLAVVKTSSQSNPRPAPSLTTRPFSLPQKPPPIFISSLPPVRPSLPTSGPHWHADQQDNPVSQTSSYSASYHHPQPSSRPALQPQSDLRLRWREQTEPAKRFDGSSYGASARQQGNRVTSLDSASIASSRSSSPNSASPTVEEVLVPPVSLDVQPDVIDLDEVDMDMSPTIIRPPPKPHSVPPHSSQVDPLSVPVPQIALHSPIHSPEPEAATPIPTSTSIPRASSAQNHLQPLSSASTSSSTPRGTPPLEPRAMKNVPKAPSYQKRSLLARKKDLEERIARSRLELGLDSSSGVDFPSTPTPSLDPTTEIQKNDGMEERLRMLVLQSQRNKVKAGSPTPPTTMSSLSLSTTTTLSSSSGAASSSSSSSSNSSTGAVSPAITASDTSATSLDDLAVSFIQETIQTYKTSPQITAPVPNPSSKSKPPSYANTNTRLELAAKQKRLEQEISETKILMARLAQARTKQEKDSLLAEMREKTRPAGEEKPTLPQPAHDQYPSKLLSTQISINWPTSHRDAGVLIVSDDEDDSDDTDDMNL